MGKGGTNKFLYIESVLQKYAGLKMFTKLPLRAKEKLKKRIIKNLSWRVFLRVIRKK